jgi:hypothetical protein
MDLKLDRKSAGHTLRSLLSIYITRMLSRTSTKTHHPSYNDDPKQGIQIIWTNVALRSQEYLSALVEQV